MEPTGVQKFFFRIAGVIGHPGVDIYKMEIVGLFFYLLFDQFIGIADAVDDIPAGDARFDGDEGEGDITELAAGAVHQLLKKNEYLFGVTAVAQVVIAGIDDHRSGMKGGDEAIEEPVAGGEGRTAESKVDGLPGREVLEQPVPEADRRAAVKEQFWFVGQCRSFFFQSLDFAFVPDHRRGL